MPRHGQLFLSTPFKITTIIDRPMVIRGTGVSRAYHAEISSVEAEQQVSRSHGRGYQIISLADGSEFAFPAPPSAYEREDSPPPPDRAADISFPPPMFSPSQPNSSWIYQPLEQPEDNRWHVSDAVYEGQSGFDNMPVWSPDTYPATTPSSQHFREYSASDPGAQEYPEWRSASGSWHESARASLEAPSSAILADVSQTQSSHDAATNDALTRPSTRPQSVVVTTRTDEISIVPASTPASTTIGRYVPGPTHLLDMAVTGRYSDLRIVLRSAGTTFPSSTINVHRVVISQSSVLGKILERVTKLNATIHLIAAKNFNLPRGLEFALQRYYGLDLITKDNAYDFARAALGAFGGYGLTSDMLKKAAMDLVLCYGAAGAFLDQPDVVDAAFELVLELFDWSNLETALEFGLHPEDFLLSYDSSSNRNGNQDAAHSNSNSSKKNGKKNRRTKRLKKTNKKSMPNNLNGEVVEIWAPRIASAAINFLVQNLPSDYHFDRTGLSKCLQDRIPPHLREEYSIANRNPMLATVAFGDHPVPTPEANRVSAILLALPYVRFREIIEEMRVRGRLTGDLIKAILQEREVRRVSALQTHAQRAGDEPGDMDDMKELGYREFAVHVQTVEYPFGPDMEVIRHEYTLHREWRGYQPEGGSQSVIRDFGK